jgi:pyruvate-formate lyase-activating enzyme
MNYNFSDKTFCTQPFSNIQISVQGLYKICCLANDDADRGHVKDANGNYMHILDHDIDEVFNSITHREHRLQLSRNEEPERCVNCYDKEKIDNGRTSVRQIRNNMKHRIIEIVDVNEADMLMKSDGTIDSRPIALDVRFGSLCNAKCIMCNVSHSSMWEEDTIKLYGREGLKMFKQEIVDQGASSRWWESDRWWNQFKKIAPNLRSLYIVGGEPLIMPEHDTMLEKLVEWDYAKNIELEYDTNLTVINPKLIKLWKHFKNIILRISVDETEDRYHLVRFPSNWDRLIKNIETLTAEGIPITGFTSSIGLATIYSPFRLQKFSKQYNINYFQRFLYTPPGMNITILPASAKQEVIETYENNLDKTGQTGIGIINHLKNNFDNHDPAAIKRFVQFMDKLDNIRNTNWRQTLPDVFDLLSRHCPDSFTK